MYQFAPMLGPAEEWPVGTVEWAERISNRLQSQASNVTRDTSFYLRRTIDEIFRAKPNPWDVWPEEKPLRTPDDYFQAVTGHSWKTLEQLLTDFGEKQKGVTVRNVRVQLATAQAKHRKQGARTDQHVDNINKLKRGGDGAQYLLRRLAREKPEILAAYERGDFKSVRAAAIAAGIVTLPTPLDQLRKDWKKASPREQETFRAEIL
jgi:hypothetical protein